MALDLNYKPNVFVRTENLEEHEWLAWRRKGIGGSDVAAALGLSPYKTAKELYFDKIDVEPIIPGEDKSIMFEIGHLLEDVVAQIFSKKTGLPVFRDQTMYQHPLFPFMLADVDRFDRTVASAFWNAKPATTTPSFCGPTEQFPGTMSFRFGTI